jgi:hypothetical protein
MLGTACGGNQSNSAAPQVDPNTLTNLKGLSWPSTWRLGRSGCCLSTSCVCFPKSVIYCQSMLPLVTVGVLCCVGGEEPEDDVDDDEEETQVGQEDTKLSLIQNPYRNYKVRPLSD